MTAIACAWGLIVAPERARPTRASQLPQAMSTNNEFGEGMSGLPNPRSHVLRQSNARWPKGGDPHGHRVPIVVRRRESRLHGEGEQVTRHQDSEVSEMRDAETVLNVIRDRGGRALPLEDVY